MPPMKLNVGERLHDACRNRSIFKVLHHELTVGAFFPNTKNTQRNIINPQVKAKTSSFLPIGYFSRIKMLKDFLLIDKRLVTRLRITQNKKINIVIMRNKTLFPYCAQQRAIANNQILVNLFKNLHRLINSIEIFVFISQKSTHMQTML